jgi:hypothetical protein
MRKAFLALLAASAMALAACESTGGGYGGGGGGGTQLSQCMRNALIGAGVGAVLGGATAPDGNRGENAALGAAAGGLGTYAVCRWVSSNNQQARVEQTYYQALNQNAPVSAPLAGPNGRPATLSVARPVTAPGRPATCRVINATINDGASTSSLPQETFCQQADGSWAPVA